MTKVPRYLWIILSLLIVFVLVVGVTNILISRKKEISEKISVKNKISNLEAAKIGLNWLNKQRNSDGLYRFSCKCADSDCTTCEDNVAVKRTWPFVIWGRLKYYEITKDQKDYATFADDLKKSSSISQGIQFNFWKCKFMYDVQRSAVVSKEDKNLASDLCNSGRETTFTEVNSNINEMTNLELYRAIISDIGRILNNEKNWPTRFKKEGLIDDFEKAAAYGADYSFAYKMSNFGDPEKYQESFKNFYIALEGYQFLGHQDFTTNSILGIAAVDLFVNGGGKDGKLLDLARYLYDQIENVEYSREPESMGAIYFAMFAEDLFKATGDTRFSNKRNSLIKEIVENRFDGRTGCFWPSRIDNTCYTEENALTVGFLSEIK